MSMEKELLNNISRKPATLLYPYERMKPVEGIRAKITWKIEKCVACGLCPRICPSKAIDLYGKGKKVEIAYYLDRCIFCGECIDVCPTKSIEATTDYELAFTDHSVMIIHFKQKIDPLPKNKRD